MVKVFKNNMMALLLLTVGSVLNLGVVLPAQAQSAIVEVVTEPPANGLVRFSGIPEGEVSLPSDSMAATGLSPGSYQTSLSYIDPALLAAHYKLSRISCDDDSSSTPSIGDVASGSATFNLDRNETVVCLFVLTLGAVDNQPGDNEDGDGNNGGNEDGDEDNSGNGRDNDPGACICPKQGSWNVSNLPGKMVCTGVMSMTMPLAPSRQTGLIELSNGCQTLIASGLSDDEATVPFQRTPDCGYKGTIGGSHEGIPMKIDFTLDVADERNMTGQLHSVVNQQGMTCTMSRNYTLSASD